MVDENYINGIFSFSLDKSIYSEEVIYKCFYWYGSDYTVNIIDKKSHFGIMMSLKSGEDLHLENLTGKIKQDLIDFKLRNIVTKETKNIRELIIAKAFAYYNDDSDPITEISDPLGFNPDEF
ncbi:MAG: His-Xaa-Ser system protein HxsD [Flavobacterium psychrophilum]|nr:MAG: His-Xaa-Ser system protein HxsD [Flavobacterium psychrophilum]